MTKFDEIEFAIDGMVEAESFPRWISAHAKKLNVEIVELSKTEHQLLVKAIGLPEMLDALMVACLLGPRDVLVEDVAQR